MRSVMPMLVDMMPAPRRSFIKRRTIKSAVEWIQKHPENNGQLRMSDYSKVSGNKRDVWYIVNYQARVKCIEE